MYLHTHSTAFVDLAPGDKEILLVLHCQHRLVQNEHAIARALPITPA